MHQLMKFESPISRDPRFKLMIQCLHFQIKKRFFFQVIHKKYDAVLEVWQGKLLMMKHDDATENNDDVI